MLRPILAFLALFFALTANPAYSLGGPVGQGFVRDEKNYSDRITIAMVGMPAIPRDKTFEAWLVTDNGLEQNSLGNLKVESDGTARHSVTRDENFLARYNKLRISVEPRSKEDPKQAGNTIVEGEISLPVLAELRRLLVHFPDAPGGTALAIGLRTQTSLMLKHTNLAAAAIASGDLGKAKENAEAVVNIVEGARGAQFGDLNQDSRIQNPGDGYGLLVYVEQLVEHAGLLASADGATPDMGERAKSAEVSATNVANWAKSIRDDAAMLVLQSDSVDSAKPLVEEMTRNGIAALNGVDADGNGLIEAIEGEGGAITTYNTIQSIAIYDMVSIDRTASARSADAGSKPDAAIAEGRAVEPEALPTDLAVIPIIVVGILAGASIFAVLALFWSWSRAASTRP